MIRGAFQIEPRKLTIQKWAQLYQEAMYLKILDAEIQTNILSKIFGGKKEEDSEE